MEKIIRLNLFGQYKELSKYFARLSFDCFDLDQKTRLSMFCGGEDSLLFHVLSDGDFKRVEWIMLDAKDFKENLEYIIKYKYDDIPDERSFYGEQKKSIISYGNGKDEMLIEPIAVSGLSFLGIKMKNGKSYLCPMSELENIEKCLKEQYDNQ